MEIVVLAIHLLLALGIVGVVLLQRSEGGGLGIGGPSGGGMGGLMGSRATANLLTRATAILAGSFFVTSIVLAILAGNTGGSRSLVVDGPGGQPAPMGQHGAPAAGDVEQTPLPELPELPQLPSVPTDE